MWINYGRRTFPPWTYSSQDVSSLVVIPAGRFSFPFLQHPDASPFIVMLHVDRMLHGCDASSVLVFELQCNCIYHSDTKY